MAVKAHYTAHSAGSEIEKGNRKAENSRPTQPSFVYEAAAG
jgi:hypothetical protein